MQTTISIRTYNERVNPIGHYFFVLNKGANSGKPLNEPCPNCYIVSCTSETEKQYWYWLCWGLWQSRSFNPYLRGSVIEFIIISDFKTIIEQAHRKIGNRQGELAKATETFKQLIQHEANLQKQILNIVSLKQVYFLKLLNA